MFHHFYDETHPRGQGAISSSDFERMIEWLSTHYSLINADEYQRRVENNCLEKLDICLSFDDALLCQYEIAAPIMKRKALKAFFFVYSSPFSNMPDYLEIFRYFRTVAYENIDLFYSDFFDAAERSNPTDFDVAKSQYNAAEYLSAFPFYSESDKWFRYLRDVTLGETKYNELMISLMKEKSFNIDDVMSKLWMKEEHLIDLKNHGHIIGLHSYSHPTKIHLLDTESQESEYQRNYDHLTKLLGTKIDVMSHPCGNYNSDTLSILKNIGMKVGFRSSMSTTSIESNLEIPREDHANVFKEMML
jgi:peptidoglycan/xylan/chitin deacetylase (PgdA/CDA1 family)